ncbi:MAG: HAD family hydrolase [Oscillospiraceae bacterium]|nr:HAD family hydrolase [Oscillospiraceae bacterium]
MTYTDLIFDLYGTLVDIHTEEDDCVWEKTAIFFGFHGARCTGPELKQAFSEAMREREAEAGQSYECFPDIPFEIVLAQLFRERGITDRADDLGFQAAQLFRILSLEYVKLYPGVMEALDTLRKKGYRLWLLSNAQRVFTEYELRHLGLGEQFDKVYISSDYQCRKPDVRFFNALIEEQGLDRGKCLMIGNDRMTDIAGAKNAGLATLYMHTALTPGDQAAVDPKKLPGVAPADCREFEFEGDDWAELTRLIPEI